MMCASMKTMVEKLRHKPFNAVYILICLSGFIWQVTEICLLYFEYDVTSQVSYRVATTIAPPGMTLCYRYFELLDFEAMNGIKNKKWTSKKDAQTIREVQKSLTISEIFNLTPTINDAIDGCRFRRPGSYQLFQFDNQIDCNQHFKINKFFILEYICYRYQFVINANNQSNDVKFSVQELANSPAGAGQIYSMSIPSVFNRMRVGKYLLHPSKRFPYKEIEYSTVIESHKELSTSDGATDSNNNNNINQPKMASGIYTLTNYALDIIRLPPPFATNCFDYQDIDRQSRTDCHQRCVKVKAIEAMDMVPFSSIEADPVNLTSISYLDLQNESIVEAMFDMYQMCDEECRRDDCEEYTYFTRLNYRPKRRGFSFYTFIPSEPSIRIETKERLSMTEFVSFILSMFGTWFGISVLTLNPFELESLIKIKPSTLNPVSERNRLILMDAHQHHPSTSLTRLATFDGNQKSRQLFQKRWNVDNDEQQQKMMKSLSARLKSVETYFLSQHFNHHNPDDLTPIEI